MYLGLNSQGDKMRLCGFPVVRRLMSVAILFSFLNIAVPVMAGEPQIIGVWDHSSSKENYKIIIAEEDDETILVKKFKDGIRIRQVVIESQGVEGIVYNPEDERAEEYYIVDQIGNLQVWDVFGLKATLKADK